jgi:hypothetical protein
MKSSFLLPNQFKKIGYLFFPIGLLFWIAFQQGLFSDQINHPLKVIILTISFFSFLLGFYFICFSKEPIEDEFIASIRLRSFHISSLIQMIFFVIAFTSMYILKFEPKGDGGLASFFLFSIILYWVIYLIAFNYTLFKTKTNVDA